MPKKQITQDNLAQALLEAVPELRPVYDEHMEDNFGDFLGHIFFGDVTRFAGGLLKKLDGSDSVKAKENLTRLVNFCEEAMGSGDDYVQNVISLSFIENIDREDFDSIFPLFGPHLRAEWKVKKDWEEKMRVAA